MRILRKILTYSSLMALSSCVEMDSITPQAITRIDYSSLFGFAGWVTTLTVTPTEYTLTMSNKPGLVCRNAVSTTDWQNLISGIDWVSFGWEQSTEVGGCCDRSAAAVKVTAGKVIHQVEREFLPGDSSALGKLSVRLAQRLTRQSTTCK